MEQVLTELAAAGQLAQFAVGRRDDTRIGAAHLGLTEPVVLAVLQHAQELGLQVQRHLADFIQEQRAVAGFLEKPCTRLVGTGVSAARVAE